jgi:HD superfamily phosphohydrolase
MLKVIRDNLHGDIEFYPEEMRLLHTAEFERLHGCRQLGLSHLIYPGAKHSRFEHVLGVMHVANEIAKRMREQGDFFPPDKYGDELIRVLRFSALLHDMGHVPFGHTLEDEMPIIPKHDIPSGEVGLQRDVREETKVGSSSESRMDVAVSAALRASGNERFIQSVLQVLRAIAGSKDDEKLHEMVKRGEIKPDYLVLADIIGNTICADLLDYIKRDHMMSGIRATYDSRIFRYFGVREHRGYKRAVILLVKTGRVRNDALADLLDILKLRYNLSDKVLFHPKKCAADAMLIKVIGEQIKKGLSAEDLLGYSDDGLLDHLRDHHLVKMIRSWTLFKPVFVCGLGQINTYDPLRPKKTLIEDLHKDVELRTRIERKIQREVGLSEDRTCVLIFCPRPNMTLKPVRALVQWKDGTIRRLNEIEREDDALTYDQVALLQEIYPQLWKLYLFVDPNLRNYAETLQVKFCSILKEEARLSATCDPAFQHYLEKSCIDVRMGRLLDGELGHNVGVGKLTPERRLRVTAKCHERIPADPFSDDYAEQDAQVLASRKDDPALLQRVRELLDVVLREEASAKDEMQGQLSLRSEKIS